jgi:PAS domain S-box-containing protein
MDGNVGVGGAGGLAALVALLHELDRGAVAASRSGEILFANREAERIAGSRPGGLVGRHVSSAFEFTEKIGSGIQLSLAELEGGPAPRERRQALLKRADGTSVPVEFWLRLLTSDDGTVLGIGLFLQERPEGIPSEDVIRDSEARFTVALRGAKVIVSTQDRDLRYTWMRTPYGGETEAALGKTDLELLAAEDGQRLTALKERVVAEGVSWRQEFDATFGGKKYWYDLTLEPLRDAGGAIAGVTTVAVDITRRKMLEQQLREAQKMEAVGRLAGGIAHDFNNMLAVIMTYAALALESLSEADPLRAEIEAIQRAAEHAASLTRQLLAFGRRQILSPEVVDINQVVRDATGMLGRLLGEDIRVKAVLEPQLWPVRVDRTQLQQVIVNLAVNARDAMPRGGTLTIETANVEIDEEYAARHLEVVAGHYVLLAVSDTGHGMDDATKARAFEPFFTTKPSGVGTGLGLSTVHGIVRQSGGNIWLYSEVGKGTTVKVYLPRVYGAVPTEERERDVYSDVGGSETILVVEDEVAVRQAVVRILTSAGYEVLAAATPTEALELAEKHEGSIDLLLTDVVLPQLSGRELAGRLQALRPGIKVLYMSGYTENTIVHKDALDEGVRFIAKPFKAAELRSAVRSALGGAGSQ